ncbi:MAG: Eco57I restriction-modification methylase domain-containing protein [Terriglobales bacterium]
MRRPLPTAVRIEGGLFSPDFLQRLGAGAADIPGLRPEDYHLPGREKLNEGVSRSWNRLLGVWQSFRAALHALPAGDRATSITREKWLLPLFAELGYGRLQSARALVGGDPNFPISHAWQAVPMHLVGCHLELDERVAGVAGAARISPHGLVQEFLNSRDQSLWGFVSNGLTLRLLRAKRTLTRQAFVEFDLAAMMEGQAFSDFALLWLLCHQSRVELDLDAAAAAPAPPQTVSPDANGEEEEEDSGGSEEAVPELPSTKSCRLEEWIALVQEQGSRALDQLRSGVESAIQILGTGFLRHRDNRALLDKLASGKLDRQGYYRQLLRLAYRLIFLFVAEARDLLLVAPPHSREADRYRRFYSASHLRDLAAARRGTAHGDLWRGLQVVFGALSSSGGCPGLGLPPLGGLLWSPAAAPDLDSAELANADLLAAILALAFRVERGLRRPVDWRNLGPEELGSVYESLLELRPEVNAEAASFELKMLAGHERKTTGSYYTPTSLVECLLDTALDPVLAAAAREPDPEQRILRLKICDPACGSGHFLIAAAHRIAQRLASVRTGDAEASPQAVRHALRDVIGHCLYGVDVNPMAVELCKVNLWLEALEPGRPLSFLDAHIHCGNALLGATPALLRGGIRDAALDPLEGDDPEWCRILKRENKKERAGEQPLFAKEPWMRIGDISAQLFALEGMDDSTLDGVREKELRYAEIVRSADYEHGRLLADAWCAAFVLPKKRESPCITEHTFREIERNPLIAPEPLRQAIRAAAGEYRFFHWQLAFPDVFRVLAGEGDSKAQAGPGWQGGFDVVLGNPPWERVKLQEKEWFAERRPDIANAKNAAARKRLIEALPAEDPALSSAWAEALHASDAVSTLVRSSGRYPLCGRGDINTYSIFAELNRSLISPTGRAGFIVPTGIATDDTTKMFFQDLAERGSLRSLYSFFETRRVFFGTDSRGPFCLLTIGAGGAQRPIFAFDLRSVAELRDPERLFSLSSADIALLNPNTRTCPIFRSRRDAELTKAIYRRVPVLVNESHGDAGNPWGVSFMAMFHMSGDSGLFKTAADLAADGWTLTGNICERDGERYWPLYEAKMVHQFNHRFGDYADKLPGSKGTKLPDVPASKLADPAYRVQPRYWVPESAVEERLEGRWEQPWLLGWRDICRSTDERTVIASVIPQAGVGDKFLLAFPGPPAGAALLYPSLNSFGADYCARQKLGGTSLKYFVMRQVPVPGVAVMGRPCRWVPGTAGDFITSRVLELVFTSHDLAGFARELGWDGSPYRWDDERRFLIRCELDAAFFHLYLPAATDGTWLRAERESDEELAALTELFPKPGDAGAYILDTFPIVRRRDEAKFGEYRTKRVILETYDAMSEAIRTGSPYQTRLDPPPGDPRAAHPAAAARASAR